MASLQGGSSTIADFFPESYSTVALAVQPFLSFGLLVYKLPRHWSLPARQHNDPIELVARPEDKASGTLATVQPDHLPGS
jgi:hypothetical protein